MYFIGLKKLLNARQSFKKKVRNHFPLKSQNKVITYVLVKITAHKMLKMTNKL